MPISAKSWRGVTSSSMDKPHASKAKTDLLCYGYDGTTTRQKTGVAVEWHKILMCFNKKIMSFRRILLDAVASKTAPWTVRDEMNKPANADNKTSQLASASLRPANQTVSRQTA